MLIHKKADTKKKESKWIYYTFISTSNPSYEIDRFSGELMPRKNEYSKIYSISNYTNELQKDLEFCLKKNYKEWTGNSVMLIPHIYDDRELALMKWNDEKGRLSTVSVCYYLMQYGVMEQ